MKRYYLAGVSLFGLAFLVTVLTLLVRADKAQAHCQVPCGIYDDAARIARMKEDAKTIAKAIQNIGTLSGAHDARAMNQAVRWVNAKEEHASHIIELVSEYFLTQRVKPVEAGSGDYGAYLKNLADHHAVMVAAMQTKQDASMETVGALVRAIEAMAAHY